MGINVSTIVDVSIAVAANFPQRAGFGTLLFMTNETGVLVAPELTRTYNDIDSVTDDWPATSEVVKAATAYFSQTPRPTTFKVGFCDAAAASTGGGSVPASYTGDQLPGTGLFGAFPLTDVIVYAVNVDGTTTQFTTPSQGSGWDGVADYTTIAQLMSADLANNNFPDLEVVYDGTSLRLQDTGGTATSVAFEYPDLSVLPNGTSSITVSDFGWKQQSTNNDQAGTYSVLSTAPMHQSAPLVGTSAPVNVNTSDFQVYLTYEADGVPSTIQANLGNVALDYVSLIDAWNETAIASDVQLQIVDNVAELVYVGTGTPPTDLEVIVDAATPADFPNLGVILGFADTGNVLIPASTGGTTSVGGLVTCLTDINDFDDQWYGLVLHKDFRDNNTEILAVADWIEARVKVFGHTTNNADVLDATVTDDIATQLKDKVLRRTMTTYSSSPDQYPSASILARAFTVNFNQPNSTITLMYKQLPGITVENLSGNQRTIMRTKNVNAFLCIGQKQMYDDSSMANGAFFDELHGLDWLQNAIQTQVCGYLLSRTTKVPYTDKGVAMIEQQVRIVLDEAVRNGLIAPGETVDGEFLQTGYEITSIPVADINQSDVDARFYPGMSFVVLGAGAIHRVQINGVFER